MNRSTGWSPDTKTPEGSDQYPETSSEGQISTGEIIQLLIAQTRDYAATELERQRLRARLLGMAGRDAAILGIVALFFLSGALVALLVGCILALEPLIGPLIATLVVVGVALLVVAILAFGALARVRSAMRAAFPREERP